MTELEEKLRKLVLEACNKLWENGHYSNAINIERKLNEITNSK